MLDTDPTIPKQIGSSQNMMVGSRLIDDRWSEDKEKCWENRIL